MTELLILRIPEEKEKREETVLNGYGVTGRWYRAGGTGSIARVVPGTLHSLPMPPYMPPCTQSSQPPSPLMSGLVSVTRGVRHERCVTFNTFDTREDHEKPLRRGLPFLYLLEERGSQSPN